MDDEARQILRSILDQEPANSVQNTDGISSTLSLKERLIKLENQGVWITAKDPDTRVTLGEPAPGALERFLADR